MYYVKLSFILFTVLHLLFSNPNIPYQPNPYNYPQQPQYYEPPPPPQGPAPTVITINNNNNNDDDSDSSMCPTCAVNTPSYTKKVCGPGNFLHCLICFPMFGPISLLFLCS